jgi:dimethylargininase
MLTIAITHIPGSIFTQGITTSGPGKPDYVRMLEQHAAYLETLRDLGLEVITVEATENFPEVYFVEEPQSSYRK